MDVKEFVKITSIAFKISYPSRPIDKKIVITHYIKEHKRQYNDVLVNHYLSLDRDYETTDLIELHCKQIFLNEISYASDFCEVSSGSEDIAGLEPYWYLDEIGGPINQLRFIHEDSLKSFS